MEKAMDGTDAFDAKLERMRRAGVSGSEIDAAIAVYERVRTARSIAQALLSDGVTDATVVALACEIGAEVHRSQGTRSAL